MNQPKSINADVIENLKALGGITLLAELHSVYIRTSETLIKEIHTAIAENNAQALKEKAHSLKSSSGNMGALQLSQLCLQLEKMGEAGKMTEAQALMPSLDIEFKQVSVELAAIVKTK